MGTYGLANQRVTPRLEVLRGFDPQCTSGTTTPVAYPVASGVTIKSGQVVTPDWNATDSRYEWVLGLTGSVNRPHFAINDSDDEDVVSAGKLPALFCGKDLEIQTPFFKSDDTYDVGVKIVADDNVDGNVRVYTANTETIVGECSCVGAIDLRGVNSNVQGVEVPGTALVITLNTLYERPATINA